MQGLLQNDFLVGNALVDMYRETLMVCMQNTYTHNITPFLKKSNHPGLRISSEKEVFTQTIDYSRCQPYMSRSNTSEMSTNHSAPMACIRLLCTKFETNTVNGICEKYLLNYY